MPFDLPAPFFTDFEAALVVPASRCGTAVAAAAVLAAAVVAVEIAVAVVAAVVAAAAEAAAEAAAVAAATSAAGGVILAPGPHLTGASICCVC